MSLSDYSLTFLNELGSSFSDDDIERVWQNRYFPLIRTDDFQENWKAVADSNGLFVTPSGQRCGVQALPHRKASLQIVTSDAGGSCFEDIPYEAIVFSKVMHQSFCNAAPEGGLEPDTVKRRRFINNFVAKLPHKWRRLIVLGDLHLRVERPSKSPQTLNLGIYLPLANPENIRLLVLKPSLHSHANIECTLVETELPSATSYEALSYVWGEEKSDLSITLNGKKVPVMQNLAAALRQLRPRGSEPRVLWVDAVCIDQSNMQERTEQVAQMDAVYSNAAAVVVWLGKETNTSAIVFKDLNQLKTLELLKRPPVNSASGHAKLLEYPYELPYHTTMKASSPHILEQAVKPLVPQYPKIASSISQFKRQRPWNSPESQNERIHLYEAMHQLLLRPWWKRVWVLQELTLAKKVSLHCGPSSVDWELFQVGLFTLVRWCKNTIRYHNSSTSLPVREATSYIELIYSSAAVLPFFFLQKASNYASKVRRASMANLLSLTWNFKSTDPRDRLYALLGLLPSDSQDRQVLRPDYRTNLRRLCIKTAKHFIKTSGSLDVLVARPALPHYFHAENVCEVPSWVPNWAAPYAWVYTSIWIGDFHTAKTLDLYMQNSVWIDYGGSTRHCESGDRCGC